MSLIVVTGPLGSGKTFYAVRKAVEALDKGKVVITNFEMTPGWQRKVAYRHPLRWVIPGRRRQLQELYESRTFVVPDLPSLAKVRVQGKAEGRAVVVIDEAHLFANARNWRDEDQADVVRWASMSRHLGQDVYLVTQDLKSLDRQVRDRLTYHVHLRNMRQFKVAGVPIFPMNFFIAIWQWHAAGKSVVKREFYGLNWMRSLYDTMAIDAYGYEEDPEDAVWLPKPRRALPRRVWPWARPRAAKRARSAPAPAPRSDAPWLSSALPADLRYPDLVVEGEAP